MGLLAFVVVLIVLVFLFNCIKVLNEWEEGVVLRWGHLRGEPKRAGLRFIMWPIDKLYRVSLQIETWDVPPQDVITRDNISVKVNAVLWYRVIAPKQALIQLRNYRYAVEQAAATALRSVLGEVELDDLLSQREKLNMRLQSIIDEHTEAWGIKVSQVQVKQVDLPPDMQAAIARQAVAERERRAKIINADGEFQASQKLAEAANVLAQEPITITLRYLQTLTEIGAEKNTTVVFPIPVELLSTFLGKKSPAAEAKPAEKG